MQLTTLNKISYSTVFYVRKVFLFVSFFILSVLADRLLLLLSFFSSLSGHQLSCPSLYCYAHCVSMQLDMCVMKVIINLQVRSVNFTKLMGGGVLHTKLWIIDRQHFYVGSANMDWRSLTEVSKDKIWRCPV